MHLYVRGLDFASFYDLDISFWNCSDSVVLFLLFILFIIQTLVLYGCFKKNTYYQTSYTYDVIHIWSNVIHIFNDYFLLMKNNVERNIIMFHKQNIDNKTTSWTLKLLWYMETSLVCIGNKHYMDYKWIRFQ